MIAVDFYPQTFHEIPKQDNPAFIGDECYMIVKDSTTDHAIVLHIEQDLIDSVTSLAKFWKYGKALEYCDLLLLAGISNE